MKREAPTRRKDNPNRAMGDERDRSTAWTRLLAIVVRDGLYGAVIAAMAIRAWQQDRPWLGLAIFGGGALLVMGWAIARQFRDERHRARLLDQLSASRRRRSERGRP